MSLILHANEGFSIPQAAPDADVLAAFSRGAIRDPELELEDLSLAVPRGPSRPKTLSVVFDVPRTKIPSPSVTPAAVEPTLAWNAHADVWAYRASEDPVIASADRPVRPVRRSLAVAAVILPMSLSATPALAFAPPADDPTVASAAPTDTTGTTGAAHTTFGATTTTTTAAAGSTAAAPAPTTTAPATAAPEELSPNLIWDAVVGEHVQLTLDDGASVRAKVLGHEGGLLVLGRADDGLVVSLPKARVARIQIDQAPSARARRSGPPPGPMPPNGVGLIVGGSLLTFAATPVLITGLVFLGYSPGFSMAFLLPGLAGVGGGIPMIAIGAKRNKKYRNFMMRHMFSASVAPTRHGWSGGLRLRF